MKFVEAVDRPFVENVNEFFRFGNAPIQSHICIIGIRLSEICESPQESPEFLRGKQQAKIEAITRLQAIGLSD
ncbi:hypothetical protein QUA54_15715 [Microcoleus sp. MOSTC5]|uniref:hypothetical protein n=1 Tax=unclassified Microcoleus TaxID=2642155 RepID=UPI002FD57E60